MGNAKQHGDEKLDEAIEESFPASDPPANTVETGIGVGAVEERDVRDNPSASRFELLVDGELAVLEYDRRRDSIVFLHTEVPPRLRGQHLGDVLVRGALAAAREEGLRVVPVCPFVRKYLAKHPAD